MKFAGSSGVRMRWGQELLDIAEELAVKIAGNYRDVVIAGDFRTTTEPLIHLITGTLLAHGVDVTYGGHAATPTLAYAARKHQLGIMITASHNPPEYNGIKLWNPDGSAFDFAELVEEPEVAEWNRTGTIREEHLVDEHMRGILRKVDETPLRVVLDCGNGAGATITPYLLRKMGAQISTLNCNPSGHFPGRPSEPSEKNLSALKKAVLRTGAELGIAHDGDADRLVAIAPDGRYINGDIILAIFTHFFGFRRIVAPVDSSMLLENFAEVIRCRVGDANVSQKMKELGVKFGGEQSGTQIFGDWRYTPDAIYAAARLTELVSRENVWDFVDSLPEYHTLRGSVYYESREDMERRIEKIKEGYACDSIDGFRCRAEGGWFLIRFSGTEPKVRITAEFESEAEAEKMLNYIMNELKGK